MILQTKSSLGGYPLILGIPWLDTAYAYIVCRSSNMTISHMTSMKQITLYPPSNHCIYFETSLQVDGEESDKEEFSHQVIAIHKYIEIRDKIEDEEFSDFTTSNSSSSISHVFTQTMNLKV